MSEKENKVTGTTEEFTIQALSEEGAAMPEIEKKKDVEPVVIDESFYNDDEIKGESQPENKKKSKGKRAAKVFISIICMLAEAVRHLSFPGLTNI